MKQEKTGTSDGGERRAQSPACGDPMDEPWWRVREVAAFMGCSVAKIWKDVANGTFPPPAKMSSSVAIWLPLWVRQHRRRKIAESDAARGIVRQ
jgi:predicted DNA-binding transcriptional regulator AlpA